MARPNLRSDEAQFETSLLVFAALGAVGLTAWGWLDFANNGKFGLLDHLGPGILLIVAGLAWLVAAAAGGRAGEVAHLTSGGLVAIGAGVAVAQPASSRWTGVVALGLALGAYMLWRAFVVATRRVEDRQGPAHDTAYQVLILAWLALSAVTFDASAPWVAAPLRLGALAVLAAWAVVPLTTDWGAMFARAWGGMLSARPQPAAEPAAAAAYDESASPSDEDLLAGLTNDEDRSRMTSIREYIKSQFGASWPQIHFDQTVYRAPSYVTYILRKPDDISFPEVIKHELNIASKLRVDGDAFHMEPAPKLGAILIQITRDDKQILWYDDPLMIDARESLQRPGDNLRVVLGLDTFGNPVFFDVASRDTPNVLLCGKAGSGKSSTLHVILTQLLDRNAPEDVRFVFVDGKRVTAAPYAKLAHLWVPVVTDLDNAPSALEKVADEIDRRMTEFEKKDPIVTNIFTWNKLFPDERIPCLFLVIDEATMLASPKEASSTLVDAYSKFVGHVAARGRAAGVYLLLATQRPSVENLGANVVGQISQRIVHKLAKLAESTMALNAQTNDNSALKLAKFGDALLTDGGEPRRFSPAYLPEDAERGHIDVPKKIKQIIEKWGTNDFEGKAADAVKAGAVKASVFAAHKPSVTDREWFVELALRQACAGEPDDYKMVQFAAAQVLPFIERAIPEGYPVGPEFSPAEVDAILRKILDDKPLPGTNAWPFNRALVEFLISRDSAGEPGDPADPGAPADAVPAPRQRPSVDSIFSRPRRDR